MNFNGIVVKASFEKIRLLGDILFKKQFSVILELTNNNSIFQEDLCKKTLKQFSILKQKKYLEAFLK